MPQATAMIRDWGAATWAMVVGALAFVPRIIGALIILLIGWGIARLLARLVDTGLDRLQFDRRVGDTGMGRYLTRSGVTMPPSDFVASLVKWIVLLITFMISADALGLPQVSAVFTAVLAYIPNVIAAIAILAIGALLADFLAGAVRGAFSAARPAAGEILATVTYWSIIVFVALGALAQLQIAPDLVRTLYTAVIGTVALAAAIAFGLGLRDFASDIATGRELSANLHPGDVIQASGVEGRVQKIGFGATWIRTEQGLVAVPNHLLSAQIITLRTAASVSEIKRPAA
jgi:small-conductance mechanosensitive channel